MCACNQGNPRNPSSFLKPPSAALDQLKSYFLCALLEMLALALAANTGELVLYFLQLNLSGVALNGSFQGAFPS